MLPSKHDFIPRKYLLRKRQAEITAHEFNKQYLRHLEPESAAIFKLIPDTYLRLNADGMILDYKPGNTANQNQFPQITLGRYISDYLPQHLQAQFQQAIAKSLKIPSTVNFIDQISLVNSSSSYECRLMCLHSQQIILLIREQPQSLTTQFFQETLKFQNILENANHVIFTLTNDGKISCVSPNWNDILGHESSEVIGQDLISFVHTDDLSILQEYFRKIVNLSQNQASIEYRVQHKNGNWRWQTSNISAMKDADGNVVYYAGIAHDITARKLTEQALQEKVKLANFRDEVDAFLAESSTVEEIMQGCSKAIVKHLNAAFARIWILNKQENILELQVSSGMYTHTDGPHKRVPVGQFKIGLIAAEGKPHLTNSVQTDPRVGDKEWAKREGMIAFAGYPLIVEGEILGVIGMFARQALSESTFEALRIAAHEIAIGIKRKQTEAALRQSEAQFRAIAFQSRIAAQTAEEKAQQLEAALLELQQTQVQLIHSEKMSSLGQLVAGIAHEINNPVNFIYGNINHAREYVMDLLELVKMYQQHYFPPEPEIHEQIQSIDLDFLRQDLPKILNSMNIGAERIRQIVLSLRNFSRLDEDGMKSVDIHEGIDSTLLLLQNRLKAKPGSIEIQVIKEYGNLPHLLCHAGQINQVFMNLLVNAIDALEEEIQKREQRREDENDCVFIPQILISSELTTDHQVIIRISDNGPGMTEQVRDRLFDPFFTTKPVGKGTGMGLSISYQIVVSKHQGKLECISAPGKGAAFVITLPLQ